MARAKVIHSEDSVQINFFGNPQNPEPHAGVIKFPGGHVEVGRCSDGTYWAHIEVVDTANIVGGRVDYMHGGSRAVGDLPDASLVKKLAVRVSNTVPHFDPNA